MILVVVLAAAGAGGYTYYRYLGTQTAAKAATQYQTAKVTRGNLVVTVNAAGTVAATRQTNLSFDVGARLTEVSVQAGDAVSATKVLMRLDTTNLALAVAQAKLNLATAQAQLSRLSIPPTAADIASAQAAVKNAEQNLAKVKAGPTDAERAAARATLATAQESLAALLQGPTADALQQAQLAIDQAKNNLWSAQGARDSLGGQKGVTGGQKTQAAAAVANAETGVQNAEVALAALKLPPTAAQVAAAQAQIVSAQEAIKIQDQTPTAADIAVAEAQLASAQASLSDLQKGPTKEDLAIAQAAVDQAQLALAQAQKNLDGAVLTAPYDGVVLAVSNNPGDVVAASAPVIVLADLSKLQLNCTVSELDFVRLALGQTVSVQVTAVPDLTIRGHIQQLTPVATITQGVANYPIVVVLDQPDPRVHPGMSTSLVITTDRRQNVLLAPNRALRTQGQNKIAAVLKNEAVSWVPIKAGAANDTMTEIISGLTEGELVVTNPPNPPRAGGPGGPGGFGGGGGILPRVPGD
jgi:HlyD family secretion protein